MPYSDATGTLLIDENAAASDIAKLNDAKQKLEEVKNNMNYLLSLNSEFAGSAADAIGTTTTEFLNVLNAQISALEETAFYLQSVVNTYEAIDQNLKNTVNSTL